MKKYNEAIMETIENQIGFEKPAFIKESYDELIKVHSSEEAKEILASALSEYICEIMSNEMTYSEEKYKEKVSEVIERTITWKKQM